MGAHLVAGVVVGTQRDVPKPGELLRVDPDLWVWQRRAQHANTASGATGGGDDDQHAIGSVDAS